MTTRRPLGITDKEGNQLWTIVIFKRSVEVVMNKAKATAKVFLRHVEYNEAQYKEEKKKRAELSAKIDQAQTDLIKNCEIIYSALFECLMHIKILRTHVECVLRWSVPPKYFLCLYRVMPECFIILSQFQEKRKKQ